MSEPKPKTTIVRAAVYQFASGKQLVIGYRPSPDAEWVTRPEEVTIDEAGYLYPLDEVPCAMIEAELPRGIRTYTAKVVEGLL